jgi:hypothetical protein
MRKVISVLTLTAAVTLAGCSSSATKTTTTTTVTAAETLSAKDTGTAAQANLNAADNAPLKFGSAALTGPVPATITPFTLTGNGNTGTVTWTTTAGKVTVYHANDPGFNANSSAPPPATWTLHGKTCHFDATFSKGTFRQTGDFGGKGGTDVSTSWHGTYVITATGDALLKAGQAKCSFDSTGAVEESGASITFSATGTMTAKQPA